MILFWHSHSARSGDLNTGISWLVLCWIRSIYTWISFSSQWLDSLNGNL